MRLPFRMLWAVALVTWGGCGGDDDTGGDAAVTDAGRDASEPDDCTEDRDCSDGLFCNGAEQCQPGAAGADEHGCVPAADTSPCLASQTCDEAADRCLSDCESDPDADGDGHDSVDCGGDDCDDADADRFPGNPEVCDSVGHDEDCNPATLGPDGDGDGFISTECCNTQPDGELLCGDDCNDSSMEVNPDATEVCNGVDENCNGLLDGPGEDDDGDGAPDSCAGLSVAETDCNDDDDTIYPGAPELCDGLDNDCNGSVGPGDDVDGDGYVAMDSTCIETSETLPKTDCDDGNDAIHPGATDVCNGVDDDCNGTTDDATSADASCNPTARGTSTCVSGACEIATCDSGYDDCDDDAGNGCEVTLATDPDHCGVCGTTCATGGYCRASACRPSHVRSLRFGGSGDEGVGGIAVDASGNIYITGHIQGTVNFGGSDLESTSGNSIFVAAFTSTGAHIWSDAYGGGGNSGGEDIAVDASGNVYVTGSLFGTANFGGGNRTSNGEDDVFVASFGPDGTHRWSHRYGATGSDSGLGITLAAGNAVVTGYFSDTVDFGGPFARGAVGSLDVFVIGYTTAAGLHDWSIAFGSGSIDIGEAVAADASGNVYMTGRSGNQVMLYQFSSTGSLGWSDRYMAGGIATGSDIVVDGSNLFVVGSFQNSINLGDGSESGSGSYDTFVASYAIADGAHRWSDVYGGSSVDRAFGVAVRSGHPVVTGMFGASVNFGNGALTSAGGLDAFNASYSAGGGAHRWSQRHGGTGSDVGTEVAVSGGSVWIAGTFNGTVNFGGGNRTSAGGSDIFLLQLTP